MTRFKNNLKKEDRVRDVASNRSGKVATNPRESSRYVAVIYDGNNSPTSVSIKNLRLMIDGRPEDTAPCDGDPDEPRPGDARPEPPKVEARVRGLNDHIAALNADLTRLDQDFSDYHHKRKRLVAAIEALQAKDE